MVVGFAPGTLTLFCGDIGGYKSVMMANVAINIWKSGRNVLVVPLEMPREKWFQRMVSREVEIPFDRLEHPSLLSKEEWEKIDGFSKDWDKLKSFYIMEAPERITVSYLKNEIEKHIEIFKPDLVVVDYIANLSPEKSQSNERPDLQIGEMLKSLRQMGRPEMGITDKGFGIVSGAQLGREALKRIRKSAISKGGFYSEDLRGSHEYSADADSIFAQMIDVNDPELLHFFKVKTRYGRGVFSSGSVRTTLRVRGDIGLICAENNDWVDASSQANILSKVDDVNDDFDPTKSSDDSISDSELNDEVFGCEQDGEQNNNEVDQLLGL
jgi:hypothetical protein